MAGTALHVEGLQACYFHPYRGAAIWSLSRTILPGDAEGILSLLSANECIESIVCALPEADTLGWKQIWVVGNADLICSFTQSI